MEFAEIVLKNGSNITRDSNKHMVNAITKKDGKLIVVGYYTED